MSILGTSAQPSLEIVHVGTDPIVCLVDLENDYVYVVETGVKQ